MNHLSRRTIPALRSLRALASLSDQLAARSSGSGSIVQRMLALLMLFGAVLLTALAAYIWMDSEENNDAPIDRIRLSRKT